MQLCPLPRSGIVNTIWGRREASQVMNNHDNG